jgi:uncharacterized membrane protein YqiK
MPYLLAIAIVGIAIVLGLFTIWGGIIFVVVAGILAAVLLAGRAGDKRVTRADTDPTGTTRSAPGGAETANERVGQT